MQFQRSSVWAVGVAAVLLLASWRTGVVAQGGVFVPTLNYVVSGVWTWVGNTPIAFQGTTSTPTNSGFTTTLSITNPTATRTVTLPDATGTIVETPALSQSRVIAGQVDVGTGGPTSVFTGLSALTGCAANIFGTTTGPNTQPYIVWVQYTTVAGRLDLFAWTTTGSSTHSTAPVSYICVGQA